MTLALAATALAFAAVLAGLALVACMLLRARPPLALLAVHPLLGTAALILLWITVSRWPGPHDLPFDAGVLVLTLAFVGGVLLFSLRATRLPRPFFVILLHAAAALFGCALLLIGLARA